MDVDAPYITRLSHPSARSPTTVEKCGVRTGYAERWELTVMLDAALREHRFGPFLGRLPHTCERCNRLDLSNAHHNPDGSSVRLTGRPIVAYIAAQKELEELCIADKNGIG
jgi:hypothetical protein